MLVDDAVDAAVGESTTVWMKEELFQRTGSFKPRGALSVMLDLDADALVSRRHRRVGRQSRDLPRLLRRERSVRRRPW